MNQGSGLIFVCMTLKHIRFLSCRFLTSSLRLRSQYRFGVLSCETRQRPSSPPEHVLKQLYSPGPLLPVCTPLPRCFSPTPPLRHRYATLCPPRGHSFHGASCATLPRRRSLRASCHACRQHTATPQAQARRSRPRSPPQPVLLPGQQMAQHVARRAFPPSYDQSPQL
jgi:hypothetical protein